MLKQLETNIQLTEEGAREESEVVTKCDIPLNFCIKNNNNILGIKIPSTSYCNLSEQVSICTTNEICGYFPENTINPSNGLLINEELKNEEQKKIVPCGYKSGYNGNKSGYNIVRVKKGGSKVFNGFQCQTTDEILTRTQKTGDEDISFKDDPIFFFRDLDTCKKAIKDNVTPIDCNQCFNNVKIDCSEQCNNKNINTGVSTDNNINFVGFCAYPSSISNENSNDPEKSICCFCSDPGNDDGLTLGNWKTSTITRN